MNFGSKRIKHRVQYYAERKVSILEHTATTMYTFLVIPPIINACYTI